ncbi:MAG TPA: hypothetical protein VED17_08395 [Nitrososphaerales archaeon]|nr:hypothetical protein [Nitrososphaerales archaeon]
MAVITLKIDDDLEERLRKRVGREKGAARGALSESVEEAIRLWLASPASRDSLSNEIFYVAREKGKEIARERSLDALSKKLREIHVDPREVEVESHPAAPAKRKMGLRTTAITSVAK